MTAVAEALKFNTTITSVDLSCECRAGAGVLCARSFDVSAVVVAGDDVFQATASVSRARRRSLMH